MLVCVYYVRSTAAFRREMGHTITRKMLILVYEHPQRQGELRLQSCGFPCMFSEFFGPL